MAAQTITTTVNFDSPSVLGLLNGEAITVNGGALTIDSDVRWGQNAAVFGSIAVSATLGGSVLFDGRNVWELPYTAASGNVPAQNALGSNGVAGGTSGATGELLRVWASGSLTPATAGGAMPATGWIKLRSKAGTFQGGEVVTLPGGATITISNAGKRSWLHIVGAEAGTITIPRLGDVKWRGEWYELGATNGTDDQTFQFPVADACPAIWVEKYAGAYAALGNAGLEPWLNAGPRWATTPQQVSTDVRGKYFGQNLTTGGITIAQRASAACGHKPASGLKVFVPNLLLSNSTSANWSSNTINATLITRYETATTQGGVVDAQGVSSNWYFNVISASAVAIRASAVLDAIVLSTVSTRPTLEDFAVGLGPGAAGFSPITPTALYAGLKMLRVRMTRVIQGSHSVWTDVYGLDGEDTQFECFGASGSDARSFPTLIYFRRVNGVFNGITLIGVRASPESVQRLRMSGLKYADSITGISVTGSAVYAVDATTGSVGVVVDGFESFGGLQNVHPYLGILSVASGATDCELVNVGSPTAPYDCGTVDPMGSGAAITGAIGLTARRVYLARNRREPVSVSNSVDRALLVNVWGDSAISQTLDANNVVAKGCRWLPSAGGQSAVYGTHWQDQFTGDTSGAITITCNEPTTSTAGEVSTALAPRSGWTAAGGLSMATLGDSVTWTMAYFALGHTALASSAPIITGTNVDNHSLEFQADTGSGWSAWAALTGANLAAVGAINPATGVKLKVRATVTTASASNLLTNIRIDTVTDAVSQRVQYPLPGVLTTLVAQTPLTGAEVRVYDLDNLPAGSLGTELAGTESAGSSFAFDAQPGNSVWLQVMAPGYVEYGQPFTVPATATTLSLILTPEINT